ncbi:hypothetical protein D027_0526B, partial [Vibrio parahaemolyticus 861]
ANSQCVIGIGCEQRNGF